MAWNICVFYRTFLVVLSILILFGKVTADVDQCGSLVIEQPTILGRNVAFTFTPETTAVADVKWQRTLTSKPWFTLPNRQKFTQYHRDGTYYLILTNTVKDNDELIYRVAYKNNSVNCFMMTPRLQLKDIDQTGYVCGFVYLRTTKVKEDENVEIEYYPSRFVMNNQEHFERKWIRSTQNQNILINLEKGVYEEEEEPNDKYVLTIPMFKDRMNGRYGVKCDGNVGYSSMVEVILPVVPSAPVFEGLKNIDDCKGCIAGEAGDQFRVLCKTSGGTQPVKVTMAIGNASPNAVQYNARAGYMAFFTLRNKHHMTTIKCTVMNDALASPLITTARVYVIKPPTIRSLMVPQTLKEGNIGKITCIVDGGRPGPNVTLTISGIGTPSAVKSQSFNANTSLYVISLTTFKRSWNKEYVKCCRFNEWYKTKRVCSAPKQLNIIFPPTDIKLEIKVEENPPHNMFAVCTIYDSNPTCKANIRAPNGIIGSERYSDTVGRVHDAWNVVHAINLNVVKDDSGKKIECAADCENFSVELKFICPIILPYPPIVEFNISGSGLTVFQGEQAHVKCSAKSIPTSNISWIEQNDAGNMPIRKCWMQTDCAIAIKANLTKQRMFICKADYLQISDQKALAVNILEKAEQRSNNQDTLWESCDSYIWIIISACLTAVLIGVSIASLVIIKKMKTAKAQLAAKQGRHDASGGGTRYDVELEAYERLNVRDASGQSETVYSELSP